MSAHECEPEFQRKLDRKLIFSVLATGLLSFTGVVIETSMNVTFPVLMREFSITTSSVQWVTTAYLLMLALIIPLSSYLKKRFFLKYLFCTAILFFVVGTLLGALATSFSLLIFGRVLQGIGTGIALPLMVNIVLEQVPIRNMGMVMGIASLICAMAPAVGPAFGGIIVIFFGWRYIFVSLLPVLIIAFIMGVISIRQSSRLQNVSFDIRSYLLLSLSFICLISVFSFSETEAAGIGGVKLIFLAGILCLIGFLYSVRHTAEPLIHLQTFSYRPFSFSVLALLLCQFICLAIGFLIPNYAQLVSGLDAMTAGCILFPGCLLGALLNPVSGRILDRYGAKKPILTGNSLIFLAVGMFAFKMTETTSEMWILFYLCFAAGQGLAVGNTQTHGLKGLPAEYAADGTAVITTLQQLAGAMGTAVAAAIVAAAQAADLGNITDSTRAGAMNTWQLLFLLSGILWLCAFFSLKSQGVDNDRITG